MVSPLLLGQPPPPPRIDRADLWDSGREDLMEDGPWYEGAIDAGGGGGWTGFVGGRYATNTSAVIGGCLGGVIDGGGGSQTTAPIK